MVDLEQLFVEMGKGFGKVHDRLNDMESKSAQRQINCGVRFSLIEQDIAVKKAVNDTEDKEANKKANFQLYLVRTALGAIIIGVLLVLWKIFVGHIDQIVK